MATKKAKILVWTIVPVVTGALIASPIAIYFATKQDSNITEMTKSLNEAISKTRKKVYETSMSHKTVYEAFNPNEDTRDNPLNGDTDHIDPSSEDTNFIPEHRMSEIGLSEDDLKEFVKTDDIDKVVPRFTLVKWNHSTKHTFKDPITGVATEKKISSATVKLSVYYLESDTLPTSPTEREALNKRTVEFDVVGFKEDITSDIQRNIGILPRTWNRMQSTALDDLTTATLAGNQLLPKDGKTNIYETFEGENGYVNSNGDFIKATGIIGELDFDNESIKYLAPLYLASTGTIVEYSFWKDVNPLHGKKHVYKFDLRIKYRTRYEHKLINVYSSDSYEAGESTKMAQLKTAVKNSFQAINLSTAAFDTISKRLMNGGVEQGTSPETYVGSWDQNGIDDMLSITTGMGKKTPLEKDVIDKAFSLTPVEKPSAAASDEIKKEYDDYIAARGLFKITFNLKSTDSAITSGGTFKIRLTITNGGLEESVIIGGSQNDEIVIRSSDYDNEPSKSLLLAGARQRFANEVSTNEYEKEMETLPREGTNVQQSSFLTKDLGKWYEVHNNEDELLGNATVRYDILSRNAFTFQTFVKAEISYGGEKTTYSFVVNYIKAQVISQKTYFATKYGVTNSTYEYTEKMIQEIPTNGENVEISKVISDQNYSTNGVHMTATLAEKGTEAFKRKATFTFTRSESNNISASTTLEFVIYYPKVAVKTQLDKFKADYDLTIDNTEIVEGEKKLSDLKAKYFLAIGPATVPRAEMLTKTGPVVPSEITEKMVIKKYDDIENASATVDLTYTIGVGANMVSVTDTFDIIFNQDKKVIVDKKINNVADTFKSQMGITGTDIKIFSGFDSTTIDNNKDSIAKDSLGTIRTTFGGDSAGGGIPSTLSSINVPRGVTTVWEITDEDHENVYSGKTYTIELTIDYPSFHESNLTAGKQIITFKVKSSDRYENDVDFVTAMIKKAIPANSIASSYASAKNMNVLVADLNSPEKKDHTNLHTILGNSNMYIENIITSNNITDVPVVWDYDDTMTQHGSVGAIYKIVIYIGEDNERTIHSFYVKSNDYRAPVK